MFVIREDRAAGEAAHLQARSRAFAAAGGAVRLFFEGPVEAY
jgi:hypothetical protein